MRRLAPILAAILALPTAAVGQDVGGTPERVTPLFAEDSLLDVTLTGPIREIARKAERSTDAHPATLAAAGETLPIELSARGISRRKKENCRFPPLRIRFTGEKPESSLFSKQGSLKLVTHCLDRSSAEQTVLREYAAYRLYNVVTPQSHRVRLARISYVDDGREVDRKLGFFIEDTDDTARRVGMKEIDTGRIPVRSLNRDAIARYALFQYLIGNTDWAMYTGPDPTDCCHNSKLLGASADATGDFTPVPYDFDNSGIVDAPYAVPNAVLNIRSVTQRVYRGFCAVNALIPAEAARFRALRPQFEAEIAAIPMLEDRTRQEVLAYIDGFFADIAGDDVLEKKLLSDCR